MNRNSTLFLRFNKYSLFPLLFLLAIVFYSSCKKNDLVPSYIHIDKITLNSTYEIDGTNSSKITDAWVYVDDDLIGIYELPATFPVLYTGSHKISVRAGVKLNGIAMSRGYYPFFETYNTTIDLQKEEIDTISPVVTYFPGKIQWKEDFEDAGISIVRYVDSDTSIYKTTDPADAFEGSFSGVANLDATRHYMLCVSDSTLEIPQNQSPVFLEMNYKTNTYLTVGMYGKLASGTTERIPTIVLNPTNEWKKIYINLTYTANYTVNTNGFKVFFEANKPDSLTSAKVLIDNIKLLYTY
ncbi:MAG: hypothetical protein WCL06_04020 [Bacteroidota bacterium]